MKLDENRETINVYMKAKSSKALGPYSRYVLWVQGCRRHCMGCIAKDSWDESGGHRESIDDIVKDVLSAADNEGITISGGEPFLQSDAICLLINKIRAKRDYGVIVYTGYTFKEIKSDPLTKLCDLIIDGEYIEDLNDDLSLRGSSNQNIICVTDRYKDVLPKYYGLKGRKTELIINKSGISLIGIPAKNDLKLYQGGR